MPRVLKAKTHYKTKQDHTELLEALRKILGPCDTHDKMASCRHTCTRCQAMVEGRHILFLYDNGLKP
jgi:hypothetical protein